MKDRLGHNESVSEITMDSEKIHISIWTRFLTSSMQAALHMDPSYEKNLDIFKIFEFENSKSMFSITRLMIEGNSEIKNVFSADVASSLWDTFVLLDDQAIKWTKARVYVYSDSVVYLGKMFSPEDAIKKLNDQVSTLKMCPTFRELQGLTFSMKLRQICKESTSNPKISVIE